MCVQYNETMGKWLAVIVLAVVGTGCNYGASAFHCSDNASCGAAGVCEATQLCSFPDDTGTCLPSPGRRYGDLAGDQSGKCVGEETKTDGGTPPSPDAQACFGTGLLHICLQATPIDPLAINSLTVINTDTSQMCEAVKSGGNYCVLAGTTITISAKLRAAGTRPLVLLASDSITITMPNGLVDVGSHNGANPETGAGGDPAACVAGAMPGTSGGGAGGSFIGKGGTGGGGGTSGGVDGGGGGGAAAVVTEVTELRGGCAGQDGDAGTKGLKGHGGGAVFLVAGNKIDVQGGINAAGEGGGPGVTGSAGGGGGGAGGMIGFDAPMIAASGLILASGGGGGEGSGVNTLGMKGSDPSTINAAAGGNGPTMNGGAGGNGSSATAAGPGDTGKPGSPTMGGGGGGGGGGAGLIKAPASATLGAKISPPATP
jgi:hypothetical protein